MGKNTLSIIPVRLGAMPVVEKFIDKLGIEKLFEEIVPTDRRDKIPVCKTLSIILRNIILERHPLYKIGDWSLRKNLIQPYQSDCMTDDRIGRSLDRLFRSDRASLITKVVLKAIDAFTISIDRIHNDSTSVTLNGEYGNYTDTKAAKPKHGKNKDFRPDLRQLVFSLTVSADEAVPIHFKVWDGNTTDDTTHLRNWISLRNLIGKANFTYVADSKLCVRETMLFIDTEGGKFVTILPQTRAEIQRFRTWIQTHTPQWKTASKEINPRGEKLPLRIFWTFDSPFSSSEGFRIIWVKSSLKQIDDEQRRTDRITLCEEKLSEIAQKMYRNKEKLKKDVESLLTHYHTQSYFDWNISVVLEEQYKQARRGRPDKNSNYHKIIKKQYQLVWCLKTHQILFDSRYDGIFPLISNNTDESAANILKMYKFQPRLEKRFEQLKTVYRVAPVFLKNPKRIEALLTLYFFSLLITSLIERTVRVEMKKQNIPSIPIYPEDRLCKAPTTDKILHLFDDIRLQYITEGEKIIKTVEDEFSEIQKQVLTLLEINPKTFFQV
ncbi:MAG TPA: IS1634 family transposase [Candidatus Glassbacteria bacterium]|nr:IS1634 family transposase [Candidatus Glassbacteria bacterium]